MIVKDEECIIKLIDIANTHIDLGHWLSHFKMLATVIILKPNKTSYDSPKSFHPIILLNTMGKLFKKMIRERLQFHSISNNFIYFCQLGGLKHRSTTDADIMLTHFIHLEWIKNLFTSTLLFDITQFFPSLNHQLLSLILDKASFHSKILNFFKNYLVGRKTKYLWNNFSSPLCNDDISVRQGSALSPILSALYFSLIFYIFEKYIKNLKISISIFSFVDNNLFISQHKSLSLLLSSLMLASKIMLLSRFHTSIHIINWLSKWFIELSISPPLKLSYSPFVVVSIK